jgi:hypothetical protein
LKDGVYIPVASDVAEYGKGPWCSSCFDTKGQLINVHHKIGGGINGVYWYKYECPTCKASVGAPKQ